MIIWSGWGILTVLLAAIALGVAAVVISPLGLQTPWGAVASSGLGGLLAGGATWFVARKLDARPGRVLVDEKTGQRVELRPTAGSFFFIPMRFWAYIWPVAGLLMALLIATSGTT